MGYCVSMENLKRHILLNIFAVSTGAADPSSYTPVLDLQRDYPQIAERLDLEGEQRIRVRVLLESYARDLERISRAPLDFRLLRRLRATQQEMERALENMLSARQVHAFRNWKQGEQEGYYPMLTHAN